MKSLSRVVWSEGMHLAPHHFQAQHRYFEDLVGFSLSSLYFKPYGLLGCELDAEALLNGTVVLTHARGVMPDGLPFHFPEDPPPAPLAIRDLFSPTRDSHLVLLAIPSRRENQANCTLEPEADAAGVRYRSASRGIADEATGTDEKPVALAVKNFRLLLDDAASDDLVALPIARVRHDGAGHFIYDPEYIAPSLHIGASPRLMALLARLVEMLDARAASLIAERGGPGGDRPDHATGEVAGFWLSHAIHSSLAPLRHHLRTGRAHPETLFTELSRLAGALCTFSLDAHPRDLPLYDHDRLDACFHALDRHIRGNLGVVLPTRRVTVPLAPAGDYLHTGAVADLRCFDGADWYLGVRAGAAAPEVAARVPKLVKVCSEKHIARLVREAFPGLGLEHLAAPPPELAPRGGVQYFRIQPAGPCWASIVESGTIGVYVPAALPDAELELAIVLPD